MKRILLKKQKKGVDRKLLFLIIGLTLLGLIAVVDASAPSALRNFGDKYYFFKQQLVWAGVGMVAMIATMNISYKLWEKLAVGFFITAIILLILVIVPGLGYEALGARRWLYLGAFSIQPSEVVKLALIIYLAKVASKNKGPLSYFIPLALVAGLVMLQPDLGTTMIITLTAMIQIFVSGVPLVTFFGAFVAGGLATVTLILTSPYRRDRLLTFFEASRDPLGKSYHIRQVLLGLGSGGLLGVGLGQSRQKYLFLPESATDSIFAVLAEEVGFMGGLILIILFSLFVYWGLKVVKHAPDTFSRILSIGIVSWIGGQAFLNIAAMVALVPLTGIPLPFFSYGGSSLSMILMACGILLNISKQVGTNDGRSKRK